MDNTTLAFNAATFALQGDLGTAIRICEDAGLWRKVTDILKHGCETTQRDMEDLYDDLVGDPHQASLFRAELQHRRRIYERMHAAWQESQSHTTPLANQPT